MIHPIAVFAALPSHQRLILCLEWKWPVTQLREWKPEYGHKERKEVEMPKIQKNWLFAKQEMQLTPKLILPWPSVSSRPYVAGFVLTVGNSLILSDGEEGLRDKCLFSY